MVCMHRHTYIHTVQSTEVGVSLVSSNLNDKFIGILSSVDLHFDHHLICDVMHDIIQITKCAVMS